MIFFLFVLHYFSKSDNKSNHHHHQANKQTNKQTNKLGVKFAFCKGTAVDHNKVNLLKFLRRSRGCSELTNDVIVLLIYCCFFNL